MICRTYDEWVAQCSKACDRELGLCEECGAEAPLHARWIRGLIVHAGHALYRLGLRRRDDRAFNLRWLCWRCPRRIPLQLRRAA